MIRNARNWLRIVLPTEWAIVAFVGLLALGYLLALIRDAFGVQDVWESYSEFRYLLVGCTLFLYAGFRTIYFHPVENRPYGNWLSTSPWSYPDPLPLGPLQLVWQDAVIVAILTAAFPYESLSFFFVPTAFLLMHSLLLTYAHWKVGLDWVAFTTVVLGGLLVLFIKSPTWQLTTAVLMVGTVAVGTQQMLRLFPFSVQLREWLRLSPESVDASARVGWPIPPHPLQRWSWSVSHRQAIAVAMLVGWLLFCGAFHFRDLPEAAQVFERIFVFIVSSVIVGRLWIYLWGYVPPISLLGRIATWRLIVPGYDVVFIAPLTVAIAAYALPQAMSTLGMAPSATYPIAAGFAAWLTLALPPGREEWQHTGHHRIAYMFLAMWNSRYDAKRKP